MGLYCTVIVGIFCVNAHYQNDVTVKFIDFGLGASNEVIGRGWHIQLVGTDVLERFNQSGAKEFCVKGACVQFQRSCNPVHISQQTVFQCTYNVNRGGYNARFTLEAESEEAMTRANNSVALYREGRESDFALVLLDQATDLPKPPSH